MRSLLPAISALLMVACGAPPGGSPDAGADAGNDADAGLQAPCTISEAEISCPPLTASLPVNGVTREVYWQRPMVPAPDAGYPAVVVYQGSFFGPSATWGTVKPDLPFGGFHQARMQALLLEHGFVVIAPFAAAGLAWQTNLAVPWELTTDKQVVDALLEALARGDFGPVDVQRVYATGISSGGYMTSRMALSYPGRFRALVIQSGSWATCAGLLCALPATLPAGHPPTRFLHGRADVTVPLSTAEAYEAQLLTEGFEADVIIDDHLGHEWLPEAPERILEWFGGH